MPVPENVAAEGELEAVLTKEMPPGALPPLCGAKVTLKETLWPAAMVTGNVMPLTE